MDAAHVRAEACVDGAFVHAAGERKYRLCLPSGTAAGGRYPLVVMLHGCTQDAADFARGTRMDDWAARDHFAVLYPEQAATANPRKCWNWFDPAHQRRDAGEPAILLGMIDEILARHPVDRERVYLAGLSAGAAMASLIAAAYPERFAGLALHSGLAAHHVPDVAAGVRRMQQADGDADSLAAAIDSAMGARRRAIPVIIFHGDDDRIVLPANARLLAEQWYRADLRAAGLTACGPITTGDGPASVAITRYADASGRTLVEEWRIVGVGHAWSGGSPAGTFTAPAGPDVSGAIVRFFLGPSAR